ncbi:MAG: hypothetical protein NWS46_02920 [Cyclobacteriaceae bacterium]|jgi:hypothetical protein|nr:hypothetical protein [Cyclobacteriaceae bacterium]
MMKNWFAKSTLILLTVFAISSAAFAVSPIGTWTYKVPLAPEKYINGELIVAQEKSEYTVKFRINGQELKAQNVKYAGTDLTFATYVENTYVTFKMKVEDKKMTGKVSYSDGQMDMTCTKK